MAVTYVDAVGAVREWINGRTATLVGVGHPLGLGAHLKHVQSATPVVYALIEELSSTRTTDSAESPDMDAFLSAQVYGGTREAATTAAVALAEELSTELNGRQVTIGGAVLCVADDFSGPSWFPDGDTPRLLLSFHVRMRPA